MRGNRVLSVEPAVNRSCPAPPTSDEAKTLTAGNKTAQAVAGVRFQALTALVKPLHASPPPHQPLNSQSTPSNVHATITTMSFTTHGLLPF